MCQNYKLLSELNELTSKVRYNVAMDSVLNIIHELNIATALQFSPFRSDINAKQMQEYFDNISA